MNYSKFRFISFILPALFLFGAAVSKANTIGGPGNNCSTCDGAAYSLTYSGSPIWSTDSLQTFQITLNVNDSHYNGGGSFLNAVAIKVSSGDHLAWGNLVSAPSGYSLSDGDNLNANGCSGFHDLIDDGFLCVESSSNGASVLGSPYNFVFNVTVDSGDLFTGVNDSTVKALYVDRYGRKTGDLMSSDFTLQTATPEPASMLLAGLGLIGCATISARLRRRTANSASL